MKSDLRALVASHDELLVALERYADKSNWRFGDNELWHWKNYLDNHAADIATEALAKVKELDNVESTHNHQDSTANRRTT